MDDLLDAIHGNNLSVLVAMITLASRALLVLVTVVAWVEVMWGRYATLTTRRAGKMGNQVVCVGVNFVNRTGA
jgi:hypothetical protein